MRCEAQQLQKLGVAQQFGKLLRRQRDNARAVQRILQAGNLREDGG